MVSLASEKTGWLNRYLSYRAETPFGLSEQYRNPADGKSGEEIFDECLYKEVKENGVTMTMKSRWTQLPAAIAAAAAATAAPPPPSTQPRLEEPEGARRRCN